MAVVLVVGGTRDDDGSASAVAAVTAVVTFRVVAEVGTVTAGQVACVLGIHAGTDLKVITERAHSAAFLHAAATTVECDLWEKREK